MSSGCYNSCHCDVCESIETMYLLVLYSTLAKIVIVTGIVTMAVAVAHAGKFIAAAMAVHECVRKIVVNAGGDGVVVAVAASLVVIIIMAVLHGAAARLC